MTRPAVPPPPDLSEQPQREAAALAQYQGDHRLATVLKAWGHGPEFIESLLSWGYSIVLSDTEASRR